MSTRRLRYTGERPQAFTEHGVGHLEPGAEFEVPEDQAERYLRRGDVEDAEGRPHAKAKAKEPGNPAPGGGEEPAAS